MLVLCCRDGAIDYLSSQKLGVAHRIARNGSNVATANVLIPGRKAKKKVAKKGLRCKDGRLVFPANWVFAAAEIARERPIFQQRLPILRPQWRSQLIKGLLFGSVLALSSLPAMAATMNLGDAVAQWSQACAPDVKSVCKGLRPGDGAFRQCLTQKGSPECQAASAAFLANMEARFAAQAAAPGICKSAINKFCSNFQAGSARLLRCLIKPETFRKIDMSCKSAITDAGWLEHISTAQ
jgi:hypothetical protein